MTNTKITYIAATFFLLMTSNSLVAEDNASETPAISPMTYPAQGGKGPGMGHDYQKNVPGPGKGSPNYRNGQSGNTEIDSSLTNSADLNNQQGLFADEQNTLDGNVILNQSSKPPTKPNTDSGPVTPEIYSPGNGVDNNSRSGYREPGYPKHRQYKNPPLYPAVEPATQTLKHQADTRVQNSSDDQTDATLLHTEIANIDRELLRAAAVGDQATVIKMLAQGASPNARALNKSGRTALILAAAGGHAEVINMLLAEGARVNDRDSAEQTALNWAAMRGRIEIVDALLDNGADINTRNNDGVSPLLYAVGTGNIAMIKLLLENRAEIEVESSLSKMTPLLLAVEKGDVGSIKLLLDSGANINAANSSHYSPLMAAAEKGQNEIIQMLLEHGADANASDSQGRTALMLATAAGEQGAIKILMENADNRH